MYFKFIIKLQIVSIIRTKHIIVTQLTVINDCKSYKILVAANMLKHKVVTFYNNQLYKLYIYIYHKT